MSKAVPILVGDKYFPSVKTAARSFHISKLTLRERCSSDLYPEYKFAEYRPPIFITCCNCKQDKKLSEFYKSKNTIYGRSSICKICSNVVGVRNRQKDPIKYKDYLLKYNYGISLDIYNDMFNNQNGRCAICGIHQSDLKKTLVVDHNHETNKVRGLLCPVCNKALGCFKDDIVILDRAKKYILENN